MGMVFSLRFQLSVTRGLRYSQVYNYLDTAGRGSETSPAEHGTVLQLREIALQ